MDIVLLSRLEIVKMTTSKDPKYKSLYKTPVYYPTKGEYWGNQDTVGICLKKRINEKLFILGDKDFGKYYGELEGKFVVHVDSHNDYYEIFDSLEELKERWEVD